MPLYPIYLPGGYPYTSEFLTPAREVRGRRVGYIPPGKATAEYRYYLPESAKTTNGGQ